MAKHVILVVLVVLGLWVLYRVRKESRDSLGEEAGA
jgi:hypothetical protein